MQESKRLETIGNIKVLMMLAVVLYHSCMFFSGNWFDGAQPVYQAPYLYIVARWLNTFHVQTFTMASGFLFYYLCKEKGRYQNFKNDVLKRAKRLLLPYFLVIITWALPFYVYYSGANLEKIIYKYVLGCAPSQLWFLPMLFLLFVVFYEILRKDRVSTKGIAVVALISIGGGYLLDKAGFNVFQIAMAFKYAGYYYFGAYICKVGKEFKKILLPISVVGSVAFFAISYTAEITTNGPAWFRMLGLLSVYLSSYMGILMVYMSCALRNENRKETKIKIWNILKEKSFGIYLFHQQVIYLTIMWLNGRVHPVLQVCLSFVLAITLASIITAILQRFKLTKALYGV